MWGKGLIEGLVVTWKHFWGKKETFYYPEQKLPMTERFRGGHLVLDDKKCIGCKLCAMGCPNAALSLEVSVDENKKRMGSGISAVIAVTDGRASIAAGVTDDLVGRLSAVDLVRAGVEKLGGKGGGGRPDMAQGGGPDGAQAQAALDAVRALIAG